MDYKHLIVLVLALATLVKDCVGLQRFAEQPKYTEVNPGQDGLLVCKVIDKRGVCSWQKDNKPVGIYPKKYEWASQYGIGQTTHMGGDCSLWVRAAQLEFDDGLWECQVTASDFTTQDALTSQPVRLVVRAKFGANFVKWQQTDRRNWKPAVVDVWRFVCLALTTGTG